MKYINNLYVISRYYNDLKLIDKYKKHHIVKSIEIENNIFTSHFYFEFNGNYYMYNGYNAIYQTTKNNLKRY